MMMPIRAFFAALLALATIAPAAARPGSEADARATCEIARLANSGQLGRTLSRDADDFAAGMGELQAAIGIATLAPCRDEDPRERDAAIAAAQATQIAAMTAWLARRPAVTALRRDRQPVRDLRPTEPRDDWTKLPQS